MSSATSTLSPPTTTAPAEPVRLDVTAVLLVAALVAAGAEVLRALFPVLFEVGEDSSYVAVGGVAVAVYLSPLVAGFAARPGRRAAVGFGAVAVATALLAMQLVHPVPVWLAVLASAAVLAASTTILARLGRELGVVGALLGLLLGLATDTAVRAGFRTWDPVWQNGVVPVSFAAVVAAALVVLALLVGRRPGLPDRPDAGGARLVAFAGLGGFLALHLLFLQNLGFVATQAHVAFATAVLIVLAADVLAIVVVTLVAGRRLPFARVLLPAAVGCVVTATALPRLGGGEAALAVLVLAPVLAGLTSLGLRPHPRPAGVRSRPHVAGLVAAEVFLVVVLLWQLYIDMPLPVPRATLAAIAAAAVAVAALLAGRVVDRPCAVRMPIAVGGAVAVLAAAVPLGLWVDRPASEPVVAAGPRVNLVQYNVRSAVDTDGQLRPDRIVREIRASHPDVVVLEEVGRGWPIHGAGDLLAYLQHRLDMSAVFQRAADGQFGNVVLSRFPMTTVSRGMLPDVGGQPRSYIAVRIRVAGVPLLVVAGHLEDRSVVQAQALLDVVGSTSPAVVAGDMNIEPDEPEAKVFDGMVDVVDATGDRCRTTSAEPEKTCNRPDWVLVTSDVAVRGVEIGTQPASDHLPLRVALELGSTGG